MSYETDNFLTKNRDFVVAEHQLLLEASSQPYVAQLFPPDRDDGDQVRPHSTWTTALLPRPARALLTGKAEHHRVQPCDPAGCITVVLGGCARVARTHSACLKSK